jgi:glycine/D-amino acid oxidase-like deaminating enzyme
MSLETERDHAKLFDPEVMPTLPISNKTRAFGVTSMEERLRVAGTLEIAGLDTPLNEQPAKTPVQHARGMFPPLTGANARYWMGFRLDAGQFAYPGSRAKGAGLHFAFGHGHFGVTGGPPSTRPAVRMIAGERTGIDPTPYSAERLR